MAMADSRFVRTSSIWTMLMAGSFLLVTVVVVEGSLDQVLVVEFILVVAGNLSIAGVEWMRYVQLR